MEVEYIIIPCALMKGGKHLIFDQTSAPAKKKYARTEKKD